ncbi:SDR family NAD(P)-dependent oxidoreductase [Euzebya tangerina]|uniref:SDR family NAD(P)-dependent oxidoreductase n=1 Tax=Euzebya tangerina TaxID=591198 RepID=UPI000E30FF19|nr:SDR family NAD(P)-dependent oxidoreductase [Euzebya tangerina]
MTTSTSASDSARPTALVVGGTAGIGRDVARRLIDEGHDVTIVGRPGGRGSNTAAEIGARFVGADVSLLSDTGRLADEVLDSMPRIDRLVQSADVLRRERIETSEGFDEAFVTAYLSRVLLVSRLLERLIESRTRILHVAAAGAPGRLRADGIPPGPETRAFVAHARAQAANDVFGLELAARLADTGVRVHVANPGAADTGIRSEMEQKLVGRIVSRLFSSVMTLRSADDVAGILLDAAERYPTDVLITVPGRPVRLRSGHHDLARRREVWDASVAAAGARFDALDPLPSSAG